MKPKPIEWNGQTFGVKFVSEADLEITKEAERAFADSFTGRVSVEILVDEEKEIIDGYRRLQRAVKLGLPPEKLHIHTIEGLTDLQKQELRDDLNHHRRPTTRKKLREIIERRIKAHAHFSDSMIAKMLGTTHDTVGKVRKALERKGEVPHANRRTDSRGRRQPTTRTPKSPTPTAAKHSPSKEEWQAFKKSGKKITKLAGKIEKYAGVNKQQQDRTHMLELATGVQTEANKLVQRLSAPSKPSGPDGTSSAIGLITGSDSKTDAPGGLTVSAPVPTSPLDTNLLVQQVKREPQGATTLAQPQDDKTKPKGQEPEELGIAV
jgi:ParB-like chromosome segregation protein Spo0J